MTRPERPSIFHCMVVLAVVVFPIMAADDNNRRRQGDDSGQLQSEYSQKKFNDAEIRNNRDFEYLKKILSELFAHEVPVDKTASAGKKDLDVVFDDPVEQPEWLNPTNPRGDDQIFVEVLGTKEKLQYGPNAQSYPKEMFRDKKKKVPNTNKMSIIDGGDWSTGDAGGKKEEKRERNRWKGHNHAGDEHTKRYLNEWLVHVPGGERLARTLAQDLGYDFFGQVAGFDDVYRMVKSDHPAEHTEDAHHLTRRLTRDAKVVWAEQQFAKERIKRKALNNPMESDFPEGNVPCRVCDVPLVRVKRKEAEEEMKAGDKMQELETLAANNGERWDQNFKKENTSNPVKIKNAKTKNLNDTNAKRWMPNEVPVLNFLDHKFNDELWSHQWYLDASISYDMNDDDEDPFPSNHLGMINSHGTRCAGAVAMAANNSKCGVGVAFNARVGGIRMLDGTVTDRIEGSSLIYAKNLVDVVSCSWGPSDNGMRVEGPGTLATQAIFKGIKEGRNGKGIIYVWASGNGGENDDCSCDGYASSIYTLSIGSASESRAVPWYGESCPSTFATAYSSGAYTDQKIVSTDIGGTCTTDFTGTSAAAPLAAGIVALSLEANSNVTWRDVQHAVVWTSLAGPLLHNSGWTKNGRGLLVNPHFGFGLLSAKNLVSALKDWVNVPDQHICRLKPINSPEMSLQSNQMVELHFDGKSCTGKEEVRFLEHVQVVATLNYTHRGALSLQLLSPQGTTTQLLRERLFDNSNEGFNSWPFTSVHTWGEDPRGNWKLTVNVKKTKLSETMGRIGDVFLVLYGTKEAPAHMLNSRIQNFHEE
ncbi:neuroendocrine convertase 1-like isoform X2 [Oratosquilla oratoria]|uniref:neuroendocrine convertase 1-like isoform X2 n=1 Tax=Oratosquilla oratoria TaxID=337810 RepID=UPI003F769DAA